jgi:uncharacterized protein YegJ (DUF2314 family)
MKRVVCGACMEAAMETWFKAYENILLLKGSYILVHFETETEITDGSPNDFLWVKVIEDSQGGQAVAGQLDNEPRIVKEFELGDFVSVPRDTILSHVPPNGTFKDADDDMQERINLVHQH